MNFELHNDNLITEGYPHHSTSHRVYERLPDPTPKPRKEKSKKTKRIINIAIAIAVVIFAVCLIIMIIFIATSYTIAAIVFGVASGIALVLIISLFLV